MGQLLVATMWWGRAHSDNVAAPFDKSGHTSLYGARGLRECDDSLRDWGGEGRAQEEDVCELHLVDIIVDSATSGVELKKVWVLKRRVSVDERVTGELKRVYSMLWLVEKKEKTEQTKKRWKGGRAQILRVSPAPQQLNGRRRVQDLSVVTRANQNGG